MKEINADLYENINDNNKLYILDFYTDYCIPCKELRPILLEIENKFKNINILGIDSTKNIKLAREFKVMSSPTLIFYKNNEIINKIHGLKTKEQLIEIINQIV